MGMELSSVVGIYDKINVQMSRIKSTLINTVIVVRYGIYYCLSSITLQYNIIMIARRLIHIEIIYDQQ